MWIADDFDDTKNLFMMIESHKAIFLRHFTGHVGRISNVMNSGKLFFLKLIIFLHKLE